jgi:hypothetical protein
MGPSLERKTGFEPATLALARRCSTPEPLPQDGRNAGIRTLDLTLPKRARYQAALHSDLYFLSALSRRQDLSYHVHLFVTIHSLEQTSTKNAVHLIYIPQSLRFYSFHHLTWASRRRLPSDSASRRAPLRKRMAAAAFAIRDLHPIDSAHAGRTTKKDPIQHGSRLSFAWMLLSRDLRFKCHTSAVATSTAFFYFLSTYEKTRSLDRVSLA